MTAPALSGLAFPFRVVDGGVASTSGPAKIEEDVRHLLLVRLGERTMLRDYGGVHRRLQEPNDETLGALVEHEVRAALRTFLPDVRLTAPIGVGVRGSRLVVSVEYAAAPGDIVRRFETELP